MWVRAFFVILRVSYKTLFDKHLMRVAVRRSRSNDKVKQDWIKVLIVDDVPQVRQGLATMLKLAARNFTPKIEVVGDAQNGSHAIEQAYMLHPDVVLMDLEMPVMDGYTATQHIKSTHPSISVVVLSIHSDSTSRHKAF